jgi:hypothetical protein
MSHCGRCRHSVTRDIPRSRSGEELLAAVDVVGGSRESRVCHEVYSEGGDVAGSDDAPDGKGGA